MIQGLLVMMLLGVQVASAGGLWVETPASQTRSDAARQLRVVVSEGYNARLIRRYRHGSGYEYSVQLTGFTSTDEARRVSEIMGTLLGVPVAVYETERDSSNPPREGAGSNEEIEAGSELPFDSLSAVVEQLRWAIDRNDVVATLVASNQVDFRYRWTNADGEVEFRRFARDGEQQYFERVKDGVREAVWVDAGQGWLARPNSDIRMISRTYANSLVNAGSPRVILGIGLEQVWEVLNPDYLSELRTGGLVDVGGDLCNSVVGEFGPSKMPVSIAFEAKSFWIRQLVIGSEGSAWVVELDDFHEEVNGMNLPHVIRVWFDSEIFFHINIDAINLIFEEKGGAGFIPGPR